MSEQRACQSRALAVEAGSLRWRKQGLPAS